MKDNIEKIKEKYMKFDWAIVVTKGDDVVITGRKETRHVLESMFKELSSLLTPEKDVDVADIKKEFLDRFCGDPDSPDWNEEDQREYEYMKNYVFPFFLPHLNSRNLLERFEVFCEEEIWDIPHSTLDKYDDVFITLRRCLDKFIESELNPSNKGGMGR